mmetsp:Transcript_2637/g.6172  ORF Transcript_2637/g.6172 Transcript_2637/m.6172 type:complete len:145 (+) Transcript_2637:356-790(+)
MLSLFCLWSALLRGGKSCQLIEELFHARSRQSARALGGVPVCGGPKQPQTELVEADSTDRRRSLARSVDGMQNRASRETRALSPEGPCAARAVWIHGRWLDETQREREESRLMAYSVVVVVAAQRSAAQRSSGSLRNRLVVYRS